MRRRTNSISTNVYVIVSLLMNEYSLHNLLVIEDLLV